jgi:predicted aldo/keto reductase-like oxidoreductase
MKRRDFIQRSALGATAAGMAGCSGAGNQVNIKKSELEWEEFSFESSVPKPSGGAIPRNKLGTTDIEVSAFGFGSHMRRDIIGFFDERQQIIRQAYELGVNLFDVYDKEHHCFQYEPMGQHIEPMKNDVVISIALLPYSGRTFEEEFERDLRCFNRDYIDMVRIHVYSPEQESWKNWEKLFKWREEGKIRAVGVPIHYMSDLDHIFAQELPIDFVLFPYNFYHNVAWHGHPVEGMNANFDPLPKILRNKGIGVMTMKAFSGDFLVTPFKQIAKDINPDINYTQAALKYVINSPVNPDSTVTGMYNLDHLYDNVAAYYNPEMTQEERDLLAKVRERAVLTAKAHLPEHYQFLEGWVGREFG